MGSTCSKKKPSADRYNVREEEDAANAAAVTPTSIRGKVTGDTTPTANGNGAKSVRPMRPLFRSLSEFPPGKVHILDVDAIMSGKSEMQALDMQFEATERLAEVFADALPCGGCKGLRELGELFPCENDVGSEDYFQDFESTTTGSDMLNEQIAKKMKLNISQSLAQIVRWPTKRRNNELDRERAVIMEEAILLGERMTDAERQRHITVLYNPVSGGGAAKRLVEHMVEPILKLAKMHYTIIPTKYRRFAVEYVRTLDCSSTDGIIIAGGDGLVHEVITGYFLHPNADGIRRIPIGITPSGTANAMAHELHTEPSQTHVSLVGHAALAVVKGHTRAVDVIEYISASEHIFALSVFGWGMAGAVALKADKLRWIPGQKKARYDIAGAVTMLTDWPPLDTFELSYPKDPDHPEGEWTTEYVECINLTATNMPYLGKDHPIAEDIRIDDGYLALVIVNGKCSRMDVIKLAMDMKKGIFLENDKKRCTTWKLKEFRIKPVKGQSPFNIDGDPHDFADCHIRVMHNALNCFTLPSLSELTAKNMTGKAFDAMTSVAMGIAGIPTTGLKRPSTSNPRRDGGALSSLVGAAMGLSSSQSSSR